VVVDAADAPTASTIASQDTQLAPMDETPRPLDTGGRLAGTEQPGPERPTRMGRKRAERRRGRILAAVTVGALVVGLTAVGGTVAAMAKTVTIAVDGASRQVTTLSGTVAGALSSAGLTLGAHDKLAPAGGTPIGDGSQIVVQRGRLVTVTIDGTSQQFWTTATTVAGALAQIGRNPSDLKLSANRSRQIPLDGLTLTAQTLHTVILTDAGGARVTITTAAATVGDLLREQGIALTGDQEVYPAPGTALTDGLTIAVRTLPTVTLIRGTDRRDVVSGAGTVGELLAAQGITLSDKTVVTPSAGSPVTSGMQVTVTTLPSVSVVDGTAKAVTVITRQDTVGDLLAARHLTLGKHDTVSPSAATPLTDGMTVAVTRVSYATTTKTVTVPQPADITEYSDTLEQGTQQVTAGHVGSQKVTYRVKTVNGKAGSPQEIDRVTVQDAVPTVTVIGTKAPPTTAPASTSTPTASSRSAKSAVSTSAKAPATITSSAPSSASSVEWVGNQVFFHDVSYGVNWDGLAHCESTNNPRAVDPSGTYFGLFQFDLSTWASVGGTGNPIDASPEEQLLRAKLLYQDRGLQPWACAWAAG